MKTYNSELEKAKRAADDLKKILSKKSLDKDVKGWQCCCGAIKCGAGKVVDISIPSQYEYQIPLWYIWSVKIQENNKTDQSYHWSTGLSEFFSVEEIEELFEKSFKDVDVEFIEKEYFKNERC